MCALNALFVIANRAFFYGGRGEKQRNTKAKKRVASFVFVLSTKKDESLWVTFVFP